MEIFFLSFFSLLLCIRIRGTARILILVLDVALNIATYNWPWKNTGAGRYTTTFGIIWPYDLLTVMAKLSLIGNCFLLNWNENISSLDGHNSIRGRNTHFPTCCPSTISASIVFLQNSRTTSLVPLHSSLAGSIFLSNMTGHPSLSFKTCGGSPLGG
jgi:hypothetical protein